MSPRPHSWVRDYEDVQLDLTFSNTTPSGRNSPHERQHMLADEAAQPMRPVYVLDNTPMASSSTSSPRTSPSPPGLASGAIPRYPSQEPPIGLLHSVGFEPGPSRMPRAASYKSIASSPLNPAFPSHPLSSNIPSPFARPGSRGSAHITRIPSEDSRALSQGSPFAANSSNSRGSMILYRRADTADDVLLRPSFPRANRGSIRSTSGDSYVSLSSDSKYPAGMMAPERGLVAYAYDPSTDEGESLDEVDALHDPEGKVMKIPGRSTSFRGFKNLAALAALVLALLTLFVFYPVYQFYTDNGRNALIVGNTRINATGQAFERRSQVPIMSLRGAIDPVTPKDALSRTSQEGIVYNLVFSDEFNTDGRTFSKDDDPAWEAVNHHCYDPRLITTHKGYLVIGSRVVPADGCGSKHYFDNVLQHRGAYCLEEGYVEISAVMPGGSSDQRFFWSGNWSSSDENVATIPDGTSLSDTLSLQLHIGAGIGSHRLVPPWTVSGPSEMLVNYVRFYQKDGVHARSCDNHVPSQRLDFFAHRP